MHLPHVYGLLAEFERPEELVEAARRALGFGRTKLPLVVLAGGLIGCATALGMQWFSTTIHYPINVGGRPLASWPSFIPITFELTVLFAAVFAVLGMLGMNGLPMPYHPVFNAPRFAFASRDRFFLCIEAKDPLYEDSRVRAFLADVGSKEIVAVEE